MQTFAYQGVNAGGKNVAGRMVASDETNLEEKLRGMGIWLVEARAEGSSARKSAKGGLSGGASRREMINFCTLMNFLTKVGIPMVQALEIAAQDCEKPAFREIVLDIRRDVEAGAQLHEALERHPRTFSRNFVSLISAGEQSSMLPESFLDLKRYLEWQEQIIADVRQATIYPAIVLIVVIAFTLLLFTFVVPRFTQLLRSLKIALPLPTQVVFAISDVAKATWWLWLLVLIGVPLGIAIGCRVSHAFAVMWDRVKFAVPLFGPLNHMLTMSRFSHNLSVLYRSGVVMLNSLKLCEGLVGSPLVSDALKDIGKRVEAGESLSEAIRRHVVFPPLVVRMVVLGEKTGNLDKALENVSEYYNLVVPRRIKKIFSIMEPALILFLVFIVGTVALAIFMPILSLMDAIKG